MNKTLLLIICDFLLLNLLALTRWEKAEPQRALDTAAPAATSAAASPAVNADMVELMRVSLEDEQSARDRLAAQLGSTQGTLVEREKALAQAEQQRTQLQGALATTTANVKELERKYSDATNEAFLTKEQLAKMQRELEERRLEAERQKAELARMERQNAEARQRIENLNVAVRVAEQEKQLLGQNLEQARAQVEVERAERAKVQEQTTVLAQGVGQLAERSTELTKEIRDNRPVNPNTIFGEFLANRVQLQVTIQKPGLFSPSFRERDSQTVLVSDGARAYALMHISDTPFAWNWENPPNYQKIAGRLTFGATNAPVAELLFLDLDPRVIVVPVSEDLAARLGAKIYRVAADPFKFPDVVLVRAEDGRYGETQVRIDAAHRGYLRVDNRISTRLFGEIAPKRGDLVFAKTGEIIGIMVNSDYCAVLGNFSAAASFQLGENIAQTGTEAVFRSLSARLTRLGPKLQ
ncbi:MAG: hypothetical protein C0502_06175 [Opitutus sp.]|nr:hypothetical protein [Opitutus sp.]